MGGAVVFVSVQSHDSDDYTTVPIALYLVRLHSPMARLTSAVVPDRKQCNQPALQVLKNVTMRTPRGGAAEILRAQGAGVNLQTATTPSGHPWSIGLVSEASGGCKDQVQKRLRFKVVSQDKRKGPSAIMARLKLYQAGILEVEFASRCCWKFSAQCGSNQARLSQL